MLKAKQLNISLMETRARVLTLVVPLRKTFFMTLNGRSPGDLLLEILLFLSISFSFNGWSLAARFIVLSVTFLAWSGLP